MSSSKDIAVILFLKTMKGMYLKVFKDLVNLKSMLPLSKNGITTFDMAQKLRSPFNNSLVIVTHIPILRRFNCEILNRQNHLS